MMRPVPDSNCFQSLAWDVELPQWPTLNGHWVLPDGRAVEVAIIGDESWSALAWNKQITLAESSAELLVITEKRLLDEALERIAALHESYFPGQWQKASRELLREMSLRLVCFYDEGTVHLWYEGSEVFNHRDVDIGLDADLRVNEVRFDG